jgi:hypothetical protein
MTTRFEVGRRYWCRLVTSYDTILTYEVVSRTAKFVTLQDVNDDLADPKRFGVRVFQDVECCNPWGRYSMAPILSADDESEGPS